MKILMTGASGFIGRHCLRAFSQQHEIHAFTRSLKSVPEPLQDLKNVTWHEAALHQHDRVLRLVRELKVDHCLHLAWDTEPGVYLDHVGGNLGLLQDSLELLKALVDAQCRHILMLGSCAEYEGGDHLLTPESRLNPQTIYAAAKASLSMLGPLICKGSSSSFCWARLFYLYGPGEHPKRLVRSLLDALLAQQSFPCSKGDKLKDYLYVEDVVSALLVLMQTNAGGSYNICSGEAVSVRDIAQAAENASGTHGLVRYGTLPDRAWDPAFIVGDPAALKALGWAPRFSHEEGIKEYVRVLREEGP